MTSTAQAAEALVARITAEVARRRNFAIISHPDAGKTTMVCAVCRHAAMKHRLQTHQTHVLPQWLDAVHGFAA